MNEAILFSKSLGLNNNPAFTKASLDPKTGEVELIDVDNMTTALDGSLERIPDFETIYTHTTPIEQTASNSNLFVFYDGSSVYKLNDNGSTTLVHSDSTGEDVVSVIATPLDIRISSTTKNFVSKGGLSEELVVGDNVYPDTSTIFSAMPLFKSAFTYNGILYAINRTDSRFLQHSQPYHYDLWNLANSFLPQDVDIVQAGAIVSEQPQQTGGICCLGESCVVVYDGSGPEDFTQKVFNVSPVANTLFSGLVAKALGFMHVFVCDDGIYAIDSQGVMSNRTIGKTYSLSKLNDYYTCAYVSDGKYIACGNKCSVEYDFITKTVSKASASLHKAFSLYNNNSVLVDNNKLVVRGNTASSSSLFTSSFTTPFSDLGSFGSKAFYDLYFTGTITGDVTITAISETAFSNEEESWSIEVSDLGTVSNARVKLPSKHTGNRVSFRFDCTSGLFKVENISVRFAPSQRSK